MAYSRFLRGASTPLTRRALAAMFAALPLANAVEAKKPKRQAQPEHNLRGKKAIMCVDGVTKRVPKRARKKYLKRGATRGACQGCTPDSVAATCAAAGICGEVLNNCGESVACGCPSSQVCCASACAPAAWENQTTFGTFGSGASDLDNPAAVAISPDTLTTWVADDNNDRIAVWTRPNASSTNWTNHTAFGVSGSGPGELDGPFGVTVSLDTLTAFVADYGNNRISVWTRPTASSTAWTNTTTIGSLGSGASQLSSPTGLAVSADALTLWIGDTNNSRISIWTRPTASSTAWSNLTTFGASDLNYPQNIALSPDELTLWIADTNNNRVSIWTRPNTASTAWSNLTNFGSNGSGAGELSFPDGVAITEDTLTVWVADSNNSRISVWTRPDATSSAWTNTTTFGSLGGGANELYYPLSVAVSGGPTTIWIADSANNRVSIWAAACPA
ncbi:MAG: NHL repeat-containing protein [Thermomicrobiales bacterium]